MLTGQRISGSELFRLGILEACVPTDELMEAAMKITREIASKSPPAILLTKHALNTNEEMSLRDGYRFEQNMTVEVSKTEDAAEATRTLLEKENRSLRDVKLEIRYAGVCADLNGSPFQPCVRFPFSPVRRPTQASSDPATPAVMAAITLGQVLQRFGPDLTACAPQ